MKPNKSRQRKSEGETGQLVFRAAEAKREAEVARKRLRLVKAQYKEARKAFKKAKKAAKQTRKLAKAASKVLKVQVKSRAAKKPQSSKSQSVRSPQRKKQEAQAPLSATLPSKSSSSATIGPGLTTPPPDISPPTSD